MPRRDVSLIKLPNGLRALFLLQRRSPSIAVYVFVGAGSNNETKRNNGVAHFLEHLCFKGTKNLPTPLAVRIAFEEMGAGYNAATDRENTSYYVKARAEHAVRALRIVSDLYLNPLLPPAEIEKERGAILQEAHMYHDDPATCVGERFVQLMYGDQPAGRSGLGTEHNIMHLTRNDLLTFRRKFYVPQNTLVAIAGNFSRVQLDRELRRLSWGAQGSHILHPKTINRQSKRRIEQIARGALKQKTFILGFRTAGIHHPHRDSLIVLASLLGMTSGSLWQEVREKRGLVYDIGASTTHYRDHGFFAVGGGMKPQNFAKTLELTRQCLDETKRIIQPAALKRAKELVMYSYSLETETPDALAGFAGSSYLDMGSVVLPDDRIKAIRAVTASDVRRVAAAYFTPARANLAVIGPAKHPERELTRLLREF